MRNKRHHRNLRKRLTAKSSSLLARATESESLQDTFRLWARFQGEEWKPWPGLLGTPPGSFLEELVLQVKRHTSIPLELPLFIGLSLVGQYLTQRDYSILLGHKKVTPELYTLVVAPSGTSKTALYDLTNRAMGNPIKSILTPGSTAGLFTTLSEQPVAFFFSDEFGQFISNATGDSWAGLRDVLLQAYNNAPLSKKLGTQNGKKNEISVDRSSLSILGFGQPALISQQLSEEDWISGLMQRFGVVVAKPDPDRPWGQAKYFWLDNIDTVPIEQSWISTVALAEGPGVFRLNEGARRQIGRNFELLAAKTQLSEGFVRRASYRVVKYALIYHFLRKIPGKVIDEQSVAFGSAMAYMHLQHLTYLMDTDLSARTQKALAKAIELKKRFGDKLTPRLMMQYNRYLHSSAEIPMLMTMLHEHEPKSAETIETLPC